MKKIFYSILAAAAILTGCNRELIEQDGKGSLSLDLNCKTDYTEVSTKATQTTDDIINGLTVNIRRPYDGWSVNYAPFSEIRGKVVELGSGAYILTAFSPVRKDAAFEQPIYEGSESFDIKAGEVTSVELICTIRNVKVSVILSENFVKELSDYTVTVSNGKGALSWTKTSEVDDFEPGDDNGKVVYIGKQAGYFTVAPLVVTVDGHRGIDGTSASTTYNIDSSQAADHHIIKLDANVTGSIGGIDITISSDVNPIDQNVVVPGFDETPVPGDGTGDDDNTGDDNTGSEGGDDNAGSEGGDDNTETPVDPAPSTAPTLVWNANQDFLPMNIDDDLNADLVINAPAKIADFRVVVESEVLSPTIAALCEYADDYVDGPAVMDMINDAVLIENLGAMDLGLPLGDEIKGKTTVPFSLSGLIPLINIYQPEPGAEHKFTLQVTDENGDKLDMPLVFVSI